MKTVFLSNYFNHHQRFISDELNARCSEYTFVSTSEMREERKALGYGDIIVPEYVLDHKGENDPKIEERINSCDVVLWGSAAVDTVKKRINNEGLTYKYSERPLRRRSQIVKCVPRFIKWHLQYPTNKPLYLLCASAFTSYDFQKYGLFKNKAYKWGYFPETKYYDIDSAIKEKNKTHILWCGRFLKLKHPDDVITVAKRLRDAGYSFTLDFIGNGEMEKELVQMVKENALEDHVSFLGSMKPAEVRGHMEKAGIYLFTSDKQEGWGAVLNESMNSGCAVVASHAIGSVPYLVRDNENGLIYRSGDVDMLYEKVKYLLDNPTEQERMGKAAYKTITEIWNARVAADRLIKLSERILSGEKYPDLYDSGPCSKAEIIKDDWYGC